MVLIGFLMFHCAGGLLVRSGGREGGGREGGGRGGGGRGGGGRGGGGRGGGGIFSEYFQPNGLTGLAL